MTFLWFLIAAIAEIAGCFAFWAWARLDKSALWLIPGLASLALFAWILTRAAAPSLVVPIWQATAWGGSSRSTRPAPRPCPSMIVHGTTTSSRCAFDGLVS